MNRRDFLRRAALVAAGAVAADQLELVERLGWRRRFFPGWSRSPDAYMMYRGVKIDGYTVRSGGIVTVEFHLPPIGRVIGARYTPNAWAL